VELQRTLPQAAYVSREAFDSEREAIFAREWMCVGRDEHVASPGDYLLVRPAGESVLVVRTRGGDLRAFHNLCRHRGSQLVFDEEELPGADPMPSGRFRGAIRCPYHAWTYGLDGVLRNAPFLSDGDGIRKEDLPLHSIDVEAWGGFVFVRLEGRGVSLAEQLGDVPERVARYPLGELRVGRRIRYDVRANWKCLVENYNECYHCGAVHPELCELVPAFKDGGGANLDWEHGVPHRDGATTFTFTGTTSRDPFPGLNDEERTRHKGELLYPNLMLSLSADHVVAFTLWPIAPDRTVIDCDFLFHAAEIGKDAFDPSDAVELWDLVNRQDWRICESVQRGMTSRAFDFGYYAPMESLSLDIRRYVGERLGSAEIERT
jgi:Rieske 2Fe-2S family protein